jgi:hypothetical protein
VGQREAAMVFIRTHDRPWASSLDLEMEVDMEIKKNPKFEGLLCEAREMFDWDCAFKDAKWNKRFRDMLDEYADDYDYVEDIEFNSWTTNVTPSSTHNYETTQNCPRSRISVSNRNINGPKLSPLNHPDPQIIPALK